jgi:hypothetical protein
MELDGYNGSSGAPVFDASHNVVGIYVEKEHADNLLPCATRNNCMMLPVCPATTCDKLPRASLLSGVRAAIAFDEECATH